MKLQFDFVLNQRFGVVEQTIYKLVLRGCTSATQISNLLWIFSENVIANAVRRLVNAQILSTNIKAHKLSLSTPVSAIIERCKNREFDVELPEEMNKQIIEYGVIFISNSNSDRNFKYSILLNLLPDINNNSVDIFLSVLDFIIIKQES